MIWKQLFRGFVQLHILHHANEGEVYGAWLIEELARHGYRLSPGTLYPILHRMEKDGLLESRETTVDGKRRRYYSATEAGGEALEVGRRQARELVGEIAEGADTPAPPSQKTEIG